MSSQLSDTICFVIMPFGQTTETHTEAYWSQHFERFIQPAVERAMKDGRTLGYRALVIRGEYGRIPNNVFERLQHAKVVLADLSDANPNVLYELGVRHTLRSRTILIIERGQKIPFYFHDYDVIEYNPADYVSFAERIERRFIQFEDEQVGIDNAVQNYFSTTRQHLAILPEPIAHLVEHLAALGISPADFQQSTDLLLAGIRPEHGPIFKAMQERHIVDFYPDTRNDERNMSKLDALTKAQQHIHLTATTGHSYLANWQKYQKHIRTKAAAGCQTQVLVLNPWTVHGLFLALGEIKQDKANLSAVQQNALKALEAGVLSGFDPIALIEQSKSLAKLKDSFEGYTDMLESVPPNSVEVRVSELPIAATVLLTETTGFFEPYIHVNLWERVSQLMLTFEVEFTAASYLYRHSSAYFDRLWKLATPYSSYQATVEGYQNQLRSLYAS